MPRALLMAPLLWLAAACGDGAPEAEGADAAQARVDQAVQAWIEDPEAGLAALQALPTPEEQLVAARTLLEAGQVKDQTLCPFLQDHASREYCRQLSHRAHLFEQSRPRAADPIRAAGGPPDCDLRPTVNVDAPSVAPLAPTDCGEAPRAPCAHAQAQHAAEGGMLDQAARLCAAIDEGQLRSECAFAAADLGLQRHGDRVLEPALELCLSAGEFTPHCLAHAVATLARLAPAASAEVEAWEAVLARVQRARAVVEPSDPLLAERLVGRLYAETLDVAYRKAPHHDGRPFDALPPEAHQAIRDALAWSLVTSGSLTDQSLEGAARALAEAEARRLPVAPGRTLTRWQPVRDQVGPDEKETLNHPMGWWRGPARRPISEDAHIDRQLALLEALGAVAEGSAPWFDEALGGPERRVAWSAARLSGRPEALPPRNRAPR